MWVGIGVGIGRNRFATGIFEAYALRVNADGGITEAGQCVDAVTGLLLNASLLLIPSGYKGGKLYSEIPTNGNGDLTWTRGSDAFRTNASGLIQRVPWNLLQQSETFENAVWTKSATTLSANTTVAPNGTTTADTLIENTANSSHQIFQSITNVNGATPYTAMIYVKQNASRNVAIRIQDGAFTYGQVVVTYNLNTGALISQVVTGNAVIVSTSATLINGYYLIAVSFSINLSTSFRYDVLMVNGTSNSYTGDGTSSIVIWGAQLVEGTTAQTYLPTTDRLNFPRLSYMYGSCPAVLLEPQRTNLLTYSNSFSNAIWATTNITMSDNSQLGIDGNTSASLATTTSTGNLLYQLVTVVPGTIYTFTFYVKRGTMTDMKYRVRDFTNSVDIISPTSYYSQTNSSTFTRISVTITAPALCTSIRFYPFSDTGSIGTAIITQAQVEVGSYATTIIPTTSATATRVADTATVTGASSLIGQSAGTIFWDITDISGTPTGTGNPDFGVRNTAFTNWVGITTNGFNSPFRVTVRPTTGSIIDYTANITRAKACVAWSSAGAVLYVNGTQVATSAVNPNFSFDRVDMLGGLISFRTNQFALFTTRLTDAQLATLTTL